MDTGSELGQQRGLGKNWISVDLGESLAQVLWIQRGRLVLQPCMSPGYTHLFHRVQSVLSRGQGHLCSGALRPIWDSTEVAEHQVPSLPFFSRLSPAPDFLLFRSSKKEFSYSLSEYFLRPES